MPATTTLKTNGSENIGAREMLIDLETRLTKDDHQALRLWLRLMSCTVRIENHVRTRLRQAFETTLPRFDLMAQLERSPSGLRMNEISKRLMVSGGNVTGITDQLEKEGLVIRTLDPADRRVVMVKLTDAGLKKFRQIANQHEEWIVQTFDGLTRDEKQTLSALLKKLKSHLGTAVAPQASASASTNSRKR
ncbi:MAG: MarR family transcriptional regulator [Candidatus Acidiferrales bacterium]